MMMAVMMMAMVMMAMVMVIVRMIVIFRMMVMAMMTVALGVILQWKHDHAKEPGLFGAVLENFSIVRAPPGWPLAI